MSLSSQTLPLLRLAIYMVCFGWLGLDLFCLSALTGNTIGTVTCKSAWGQVGESEAVPTPTLPPQSPAPAVIIEIDEAGNLILRSDDPQALDRLEEIMRVNRPPARPYDVFELKYARATWVKLNLDEYFEDRDEDNNRSRFSFWDFDSRNQKDESRQLGDKPKLRFIADNDTKSIVVIGADDLDRQTIKELIRLWDVPEPQTDSDTARYTELVKIEYSRADAIAATLKEAYRDLLSANDKTFQEGDEESKRTGGGSGVQEGGGLSYNFKGQLSLGVDSITNSILVSAEGKQLLQIIVEMIKELDRSAQPQGDLTVYKLPAGVNGKSIRETLNALLNTPKQQNDKQQQQQQQEAQQQQQSQQQQAGNAFDRSRRDQGNSRRGRR